MEMLQAVEPAGRKLATKESPFLRLPAELRLMIYEYALAIPNDYMDRPLIVVDDRGKTFTARGRYRALCMCPSWVGENGRVRNMLSVNRQLHDEVEDFVYSHNTLFFRNSFDLDRVGAFLDTLSATARNRIRSVGFEVFFFVHSQTGVPKRTLKEYERAGRMLSEKLPNWTTVLLYLDPRFYFPSAAVGGRELSARGVWYLATVFGKMRKELQFLALPSIHRHVISEAQRMLQMGRRNSQEKSCL
ncbi:hypothetical protein P170DRAFT_469198 [Aspergillus steynii IBT 23096]|uniref:Uncharacterized protein n=1 Tax=Aspergillus steynii IBT 23096 TaxID=1392250 RepID=A0A2I2GLF3_9EURO|nr:uncharacterized protein P170DRAFT_469198 [Aspergillus steynii IBT 23096]PLB53704.1 hypothetical protein P170DRAFT_469198 [Aspergillus steynii IBT 23096]